MVGSTGDSSFNWSHGFIWQNGVMTALNTLFPASSNLYATMVEAGSTARHTGSFSIRRFPASTGCDQTVVSIFMSRLRHCVECPKCRTRYLPSFSPYRNGSYLIPLTAHGAAGWLLYCSCRTPPASSQWGWTDLKRYEICGQAYRRGYGSPDEVWDVTQDIKVRP